MIVYFCFVSIFLCFKCVMMDVRFGLFITVFTISAVKAHESWDNAIRHCTLATPAYSIEGHIVDISDPGLESLGLRNGESAWVGYTQSYQVFQYIGCVEFDILYEYMGRQLDNFKTFRVQADPGQCFSACNTATFGIMYVNSNYSECSCFENKLQFEETVDLERHCNKFCVNPRNTACGGEDNEKTYVSLYEKVTTNTPVPQSDKLFCNSVLFRENDFTCEWKECLECLYSSCWSNNSASSKESEYTTRNWFEIANYCFEQKKYPLRYNELDKAKTEKKSIYFWTGMIRTPVIVKHSEQNSFAQVGYVLAIVNNTKKYRLHFTANTDLQKPVFCKQQEKTNPTGKSTDIISSTITSTTDETKTDKHTKNDNSKSESQYILPVIGAVLGFLLLVGIIVGVVCVCKRRRKKSISQKQNVNSTPPPGDYEMAYATANQPKDTRNHEDGQNYVDVNAADNTYAEACETTIETQPDDTYNHTNTSFKQKSGNSDNGDTYNHLGAINKTSPSEANTYDTTNTKTAITKEDGPHPLYNTKTSEVENEYNTTETTLSKHNKLQNVTDNVYNTIENETDDTYSHTNANVNKKDEIIEYDVCSNNQRQ